MNTNNATEIRVVSNIVFFTEGDKRGQVDLTASLAEAEKAIKDFADNYSNRSDRVRTVVNKIWESGTKNTSGQKMDLRQLTHASLTRMACTALDLIPDDDNLKELSPLVEQVMSADNRFGRISRGPRAGWHYLEKYTDAEERAKIVKQVSGKKDSAEAS